MSAGKTKSVYLKLKKEVKTGSIKVIVKDDSGNKLKYAKIYLDGKYKGKTNSSGEYTIKDVSEGSHTVKATKSGYEDDSENVYVSAGKTKSVYLKLKKEGGDVNSIAEKYKKSDEHYTIFYISDRDLYFIVYFKSKGYNHEDISGSLVVTGSGEIKKKSSISTNVWRVPAVILWWCNRPACSEFQKKASVFHNLALEDKATAEELRKKIKEGCVLYALNFVSLLIPSPSSFASHSYIAYQVIKGVANVYTGCSAVQQATFIYILNQMTRDYEDLAIMEEEYASSWESLSFNGGSTKDALNVFPSKNGLGYKIVSKYISLINWVKELNRVANTGLDTSGLDEEISKGQQLQENMEIIKNKIEAIVSILKEKYRG